jgi:deaminated glutathione amidase
MALGHLIPPIPARGSDGARTRMLSMASFVGRFRRAAKQANMHVVATFLEAGDPRPFNAAVLIVPDGRTVLHHRKVHVCDFDVPESATAPGSGFEVAHIHIGGAVVGVGLMICMDREYPEAARALSRGGAEIALVPNCCDLATDLVVGDVRIAQMRGRAFEDVMGIAVANYARPRCDGHSFAVDAIGRILVEAEDKPGIVVATFDLTELRRLREEEGFRWR